MTKHTPGPLTTKVTTSQQFDQRGDTAIISNGQIIGEAFARSSAEDEHPAEANATLWAAAPELADALEEMLRMARAYSENSECEYGGEEAMSSTCPGFPQFEPCEKHAAIASAVQAEAALRKAGRL